MNYEANVIFLRRMREEIVTQRLALGFNPVKKESFAYSQLLAKADGWKRQIEGMQRELKSKSHHNAMVLQSQGRGAGSYSAQQSHNDKQKNVGELYLMTLGINAVLAELLDAAFGGGGPTKVALDGLGNSFKKLAELAANPDQAEALGLGASQQEITATVRQLEHQSGSTQPVIPSSGIENLLILALSLIALIKSGRNRNV